MPGTTAALQRDVARQAPDPKVSGKQRSHGAEHGDHDHYGQYPLEQHTRPFVEGESGEPRRALLYGNARCDRGRLAAITLPCIFSAHASLFGFQHRRDRPDRGL